MLKKFAKRTLPFVVAVVLACFLVPRVVYLAHYTDSQTEVYDSGIAMMTGKAGPMGMAMAPNQLYQSTQLYKVGEKYDWSQRFLLPPTDKEMAALAWFHIGNVLRMEKKPKKALMAYVMSLRLNPGQKILPGVSGRDDPLHQYGRDFCATPGNELAQKQIVSGRDCQLLRLQKEADDTRNNLFSLLAQHPELKKALGNPNKMKPGKGKGKGSAQHGNKKKPGMPGKPSNKPGHNNNNSI